MRVVFCGNGDFGVPVLEALVLMGHQVAGVITSRPRRSGRGGRVTPTHVARAAGRLGLAIVEAEDVNSSETLDRIRSLAPQAICVVDFGQLVAPAVREAAAVAAFNLHGSLLPRLRGAAPVNWAIIRGHRRTGVTTFELVDKMDAGPIYVQIPTEIAADETADGLRARLGRIGVEAVARTLRMLAAGDARPVAQDESKVTYAPKLTKADGRIDWSDDAAKICNLVRGCWSWPTAQAVFAGSGAGTVPVALARAAVADGPAQGPPGAVDGDLLVSTGEGRLAVESIRPAGKRMMEWRDFVNGYRVKAGDGFIVSQ